MREEVGIKTNPCDMSERDRREGHYPGRQTNYRRSQPPSRAIPDWPSTVRRAVCLAEMAVLDVLGE